MKPAFLRLEQLTVERFLVQVIREHDPDAEESSIAHTTKVTELSHSGEDGNLWRVAISIKIKPTKTGRPPPYRVEVDLSGLFVVTDLGRSESDLARLVGVNGASILYSAAREHIFLITSRSAWGGFQLPTVTFADLVVKAVSADGGSV